MRHRTIGDWFFLLTVALPVAALLSLLGGLGVCGILGLLGADSLVDKVLPVFLVTTVGIVGFSQLLRVLVLVAAMIGVVRLIMHRAVLGAASVVRTTIRGV